MNMLDKVVLFVFSIFFKDKRKVTELTPSREWVIETNSL